MGEDQRKEVGKAGSKAQKENERRGEGQAVGDGQSAVEKGEGSRADGSIATRAVR